MILIIDNSEDGKVVLSFFLNNKFAQRIFKTKKQNSNLAICLATLLSELHLALEDIQAVGVVVGEGRFTAVRLAVTFANTLAFGLKIPVISLAKNFDQTKALQLFKQAVTGQYVAPTYSGEARIG